MDWKLQTGYNKPGDITKESWQKGYSVPGDFSWIEYYKLRLRIQWRLIFPTSYIVLDYNFE